MKIKKLMIVLTAMMMFILCASATVYAEGEVKSGDFIKVGLKYGSSSLTSCKVSSEDGLVLCSAANGISPASSDLTGINTVYLTLSNGIITVRDTAGNDITTINSDGTQCIASASVFTSNAYVICDDVPYRGGIMPYLNSSGQMNVINYIDIEDYAKGVISSEIGYTSHAEALKAQAVTVRSFAKVKAGTHSSQGFDICATTHCQVYKGVNDEHSTTNDAVDATKGKLLYYNGQVVAGFYSANSGGHTENSEDVWVTALGYLRGIKDDYSPEYTWNVELTRAQLTNALSSKGIGKVKSVAIDKVNDSGYVASLTVTGENSSVTVTKDSVRSVFSSEVSLKSRLFTISTKGGAVSNSGSSSSDSTSSGGTGNYYVVSSSGKSILTSSPYIRSSSIAVSTLLNGLKILGNNGNLATANVSSSNPVNTPALSTVSLSSDSDVLVISGKGYGHGVGMSQQGAQQMGLQGFSYLDILNYYYTDIEVR